jgi:hypothetical protein
MPKRLSVPNPYLLKMSLVKKKVLYVGRKPCWLVGWLSRS